MLAITPCYLPVQSKRRSGLKIAKVLFIVAHDTGNSGSTAKNNVDYYTRTANEQSASAHLFVDDIEIRECVPALTAAPEKAWHVNYDRPEDNKLFGDDANDAAIGVELCFGGKVDFVKSYANYVDVLALLCARFGLDPRKHIIGHCHLDPARRSDPINALSKNGKTYEGLIADVATKMGIAAPAAGTTQVATTHLNVRAAPNRTGTILRVVEPGATLVATRSQIGESVNGISTWYTDGTGWWWAGGVK